MKRKFIFLFNGSLGVRRDYCAVAFFLQVISRSSFPVWHVRVPLESTTGQSLQKKQGEKLIFPLIGIEEGVQMI